jgi:hypothetical protein
MHDTLITPASSPFTSAIDLAPGRSRAEGEAADPARPMATPAFFDEVPAMMMYDALAETLGAVADGVIEYRYLDAVKLAGHSCPTVAGAWLMTRVALARLYPGEMPRRGELQVEMRDPQDAGVTGVIASVAGLVTGAAGPGGFHGLGGQHVRRGLLAFGRPMRGQMRITRLDTGQSVELSHHGEAVPRPLGLGQLIQEALAPAASSTARRAFASAWQGWVRTMLIDHADDPALIIVEQ